MPDLDSILADVREHYQPDPGAKQRVRRTLAVGIAAGTVATASQLSSANAAASGGSLVNGAALGNSSALSSGALANGSGASLGAGQAAGLATGGVVGKGVGVGLVVKLSASLGVVAALGAGAMQLTESAPPAPVVEVAERSNDESTRAAPKESAATPDPEVAAVTETPTDVMEEEVTQEPSLVEPSAEAKPVTPSAKRVQPRPVVAGASPPREPSTMLEQLGLIREASKALRAGDSAKASRLLDEHKQRFPKSALRSERRGLELLVKCMGGVSAATRAAAERFVAGAPSAPLAAHVEKQCLK